VVPQRGQNLNPQPPVSPTNPQRIQVSLSAQPDSVEVGKPISLTATSVPANPNFRYRFIFGDGTQTDWQDSSNVSHTYSVVRAYYPRVEVAFRRRESVVLGFAMFDHVSVQPTQVVPPITPSPKPSEVRVEPTTSNWLWYVIAIVVGAIVIGGAYKVLKSLFTPEPTFVAYPEIGSGSIKDAGAASLIQFEINVNPNLAEGFYDIMTNAPNLISAERDHP
jgi:hypothetical protein